MIKFDDIMTKFSLFATTALTLCCVACQSTPPVQQSKPVVQQPLPAIVNQPTPSTATVTENNNQTSYSNNTLVIFFKDAFKPMVVSAVEQRQAEIIYDYNLMNGFAIRLSSNDNVSQAVQELSKVTGVISVK